MKLKVSDYVIRWNNKYKLDYIYRKKYGLAFLGTEHRNMNPIDIALDILEEKLMQEHIKKTKKTEVQDNKKDFEKFKKNFLKIG